MTTYRICKYCGDMHSIMDWPDNHLDPEPARSSLPAPHYINDIMPPTRSMGNGKLYDSKAAMRAHYKRDGFVEVGNDPARLRPFKRPEPNRKEIRTSIEKAVARFDRRDVSPHLKDRL